jgi:hypothetical protein
MEQLTKLLKEHDNFFEYSDDMNSYSRGKAQKETIVKLIMSLENLIYSKALIRYKELINA